MAAADYHLCHLCGRKAFYDADVSDDRYLAVFMPDIAEPIGIAVLCVDCNKTHEAVFRPRQQEASDE